MALWIAIAVFVAMVVLAAFNIVGIPSRRRPDLRPWAAPTFASARPWFGWGRPLVVDEGRIIPAMATTRTRKIEVIHTLLRAR